MTVGRPFQPGQSGNPSGRPKTKPFKSALKKIIEEAGTDQDHLEIIGRALLLKASEGDVQAIKEVADRLDGKVPQGLTGEDGGPIQIQQIERIIVDPSDPNS